MVELYCLQADSKFSKHNAQANQHACKPPAMGINATISNWVNMVLRILNYSTGCGAVNAATGTLATNFY
jgi:hypothetical protein